MKCDCGRDYHRINYTGCHDRLRDWYECVCCGAKLSLIEYNKRAGIRKEREKNKCPCYQVKKKGCILYKVSKDKYVGDALNKLKACGF